MLKVMVLVLVGSAPLPLHGEERFGLEDGADQGVHLAHVATQPEQPAARARQHQDNLPHKCIFKSTLNIYRFCLRPDLNDALVRTPGHHEGQHYPHHAPQCREYQHGQEGGPHAESESTPLYRS